MLKSSWIKLFSVAALVIASGCSHDIGKAIADYDQGNIKKAVNELHPLAESGNSDAQVILGIMYVRGWGVPHSSKKAWELWQKSAKAGNARAIYDLGMAHHLGNVPNPSPEEAVKWWRKAAEKNYPPAFIRLAEAASRGRGLQQDKKKLAALVQQRIYGLSGSRKKGSPPASLMIWLNSMKTVTASPKTREKHSNGI